MFSQHSILGYNYAVVSLQIALQAQVKSKGKCKEKRRKKTCVQKDYLSKAVQIKCIVGVEWAKMIPAKYMYIKYQLQLLDHTQSVLC